MNFFKHKEVELVKYRNVFLALLIVFLIILGSQIFSNQIKGIPLMVKEKENVNPDYAYVKLNENYDWGEAVDFMKENGARVTHVMPQYNVVYASNLNKEILKSKYVKKYSYSKVNSDSIEAKTWNKFLDRKEEIDKRPEIIFDKPDLVDDSIFFPDKTGGITYYPTSEYFLGNIFVGVILPESNGSIDPNAEDWTSSEEADVYSEIISGLDWWNTKLNENTDIHDLTFTYEFNYRVPTSYEPIINSQAWKKFWMTDTLQSLGYGFSDPDLFYDSLYDYLLNKINDSGTDWGFVTYVVDSSNDDDGEFLFGNFALSALGGPYIVMTYKNDGYGIANMDAVMAHETAHTFWALDEYSTSNCNCDDRTGYLNVDNQNCDNLCLMDDSTSIMRGGFPLMTKTLDAYTKEQIGWRDSDDDGIFDILDTEPETILYQYLPDPTSDNTPNYQGNVYVVPYPNNNPCTFYLCAQKDYSFQDVSLNDIVNIMVNPSSTQEWLYSSPSDGSFDSGYESFTLQDSDWPFGLINGVYEFRAKAVNNWGNEDESYATDQLTIDKPQNDQGSGSPLFMKINRLPNQAQNTI